MGMQQVKEKRGDSNAVRIEFIQATKESVFKYFQMRDETDDEILDVNMHYARMKCITGEIQYIVHLREAG